MCLFFDVRCRVNRVLLWWQKCLRFTFSKMHQLFRKASWCVSFSSDMSNVTVILNGSAIKNATFKRSWLASLQMQNPQDRSSFALKCFTQLRVARFAISCFFLSLSAVSSFWHTRSLCFSGFSKDDLSFIPLPPLHDLVAPNSATTRERLPWHAPIKFSTPETCEKRVSWQSSKVSVSISCNLTTDESFLCKTLNHVWISRKKCTQSKVRWLLVSLVIWLVDKGEWQRIKLW